LLRSSLPRYNQIMSEPEEKPPATASPSLPSDNDGVDVTLIRWMLSLTPHERLEVLKQNINSIQRLLDAKNRF
jgi:hypothetical protein